MTIEQYLQGKVDFNLSDDNIHSILFDRGVTEGADVSSISERQRELCLADLYMLLANSSVSSSGEYESDGGWQRSVSAKNVHNRNGLVALADRLYKKWGESTPSTSGKVTFKSLY